MRLVIVHYHLRPGGIRRVIELAVPQLVRAAPRPITRIVLATGQRADEPWHQNFARKISDVPVEVQVDPSFNYLSEQRGSPRRILQQIHAALEKLFTGADSENCLVWAHNLGVGRNLILSRELAAACDARGITLVSHHHDWWFDNRWARWPQMRAVGFRTLGAAARAVFPSAHRVVHAAINHADAAVLARHFSGHARWLPNLTEPAPLPPTPRVQKARRWLEQKLAHNDAPVWLLPCRTLRRKNIAEALLLTRWLRPEAWLVVTGAASSDDEAYYFQSLERAAQKHGWPLKLGVLADAPLVVPALAGSVSSGTPGDRLKPGLQTKPAVAELLAASEAVLLTSIQEGFGLPYLEAATAQRPLIARRLPNIAPDLDRFGFRFPQAYDEILIAPELFNWPAEQARQKKLFHAWRTAMPAPIREQVPVPLVLAARRARTVPFSRLTLTAQLEVLAHPVHTSWEMCAPLNPFLAAWRRRAQVGRLSVTPWPRSAGRWLGGAAYARKFFAVLAEVPGAPQPALSPAEVQADFIRQKLSAQNLYPLLWNNRT